jgi:hypothetical protein
LHYRGVDGFEESQGDLGTLALAPAGMVIGPEQEIAMRFIQIFALAAMIAPTAALAEPGHDGPCRSEVHTLCAGVQPGGGRIRDCMKEHRAQLSTACKVAIADRMLEHAGRHPGDGPGMGANAMERGGQRPGGGGASIKPVPGGN